MFTEDGLKYNSAPDIFGDSATKSLQLGAPVHLANMPPMFFWASLSHEKLGECD